MKSDPQQNSCKIWENIQKYFIFVQQIPGKKEKYLFFFH
ncbi:hypothetical protein LLB_0419 [Legionella longbeachae D-4968]|nr:hypothetical protein LLB_0419 [Legionella longbeachae D-4968]